MSGFHYAMNNLPPGVTDRDVDGCGTVVDYCEICGNEIYDGDDVLTDPHTDEIAHDRCICACDDCGAFLDRDEWREQDGFCHDCWCDLE